MIDKAPFLTKEQQAAIRQTLGCVDEMKCVHCVNTYSGHDSESYRCYRCGASYKLYDDEMR